MKKKAFIAAFYFSFILLSGLIYYLHIVIFKDPEHTYSFFLHEVAFLPLETLVGTFIIEKLLHKRDKAERIGKLHVVVNIFFSEFGIEFISKIFPLIKNHAELKPNLLISENWTFKDFKNSVKQIESFSYKVALNLSEFEDLKVFLSRKRYFLISFFENQNLMEHDTFTDALMAVYHVHDEFQHRSNLSELSVEDVDHISTDIEQAYRQLLVQWIYYMENLKKNYPYLFGFSIKNNPLG